MSKDAGKRIALALGANLGQPEVTFQRACEMLEAGGVSGLQMASCLQSEPVGCHPGTPDFTNSAVIGSWNGTAQQLLELTQSIEERLGRPREHDSQGSRLIDIDILLVDDLILDSPKLCIPHPRMCERLFVLQPLAEIAADWIVPTSRKTVQELLLERVQGAGCRVQV